MSQQSDPSLQGELSLLHLDPELTVELLTVSLREEIQKASFSRAVVGVSGGIDSALSLSLAVRALGKESVLAVFMPFQESAVESHEDAGTLIQQLGVESLTIDITPQIEAYFSSMKEVSPLRRGNKMARERMSILYDLSSERQALVVGTTNRTELLLGYGTLHGDTASAINPLGDLYKTQVRQLAAYMEVPESILTKPPSADLWEGQTDEQELGFLYTDIDRLLYYMIDLQYPLIKLRALRFADAFIEKISRRVIGTQYKRCLPIILKVSQRTMGMDFRYLRDWGS
ncbi:NAD+ synthase [Pasteuria penetrans]|uniref:NAD+ synthase n=1 Tax=Pasteuria penetrans TaxID=86005 RepID=UPI000F90DF91|nr:NAD+ synthase [Pasteuria penetrans]